MKNRNDKNDKKSETTKLLRRLGAMCCAASLTFGTVAWAQEGGANVGRAMRNGGASSDGLVGRGGQDGPNLGGRGGQGGPNLGGRGGQGGPNGGGRGGVSAPIVEAPKMRSALSETERANAEALRLQMVKDGVAFLKKAQMSNGSFSASPRAGVGPTIVVATALLRCGVSLDDPTLAKALAFLEDAIQDDGGIYSSGGHVAAYESCLGLVCFDLANKAAGDGRYDAVVANAEKYVRGTQYNEASGVSQDEEYFGGVGYGAGSGTRPDLSNTQFFVEALREIGADEDDPAIQDALVFVSRCQNLESEANPVGGSTAKTNDGGFIYTFVSEQENPAGQEVNGGLRSYGSMTYAGLKSLIYAGLTADDPRVQAATSWIRDNYTMEQNPGLGKRGLYYYYHTASKCLKTLGMKTFVDKNGAKHDWRRELVETLALAQNVDGSWANTDRMWMETDANLVTGYVLTVLAYCAAEAE